jgi:hypothetical protein
MKPRPARRNKITIASSAASLGCENQARCAQGKQIIVPHWTTLSKSLQAAHRPGGRSTQRPRLVSVLAGRSEDDISDITVLVVSKDTARTLLR